MEITTSKPVVNLVFEGLVTAHQGPYAEQTVQFLPTTYIFFQIDHIRSVTRMLTLFEESKEVKSPRSKMIKGRRRGHVNY